MTFDPSEEYDESRMCLSVEGEFQGRGLTAYCSPDAEGKTYFEDGTPVGGIVTDTHGAPFKVDIVLYDETYPGIGTMKPIRDEIGESLSAQFEGKIDSVFDKIKDSDDALGEILETDADSL